MALRRLVLVNIRGFESLELDLDPRLTLLVGRNGAGKSSVLEAIAIAGSLLASDSLNRDPSKGPPPGLVRVGWRGWKAHRMGLSIPFSA